MTFNIKNMLKPEVYDHPVNDIQLIETHISWVILTGSYAYKIKKPVDFGFLDFSTLEKRLDCCRQELRLNRRLAPAIYIDVVAITGTFDKPVISGDGAPLEYAVKMTQFPQSAQLDNMLHAGELKPHHMDSIAYMVSGFHQSIEIADNSVVYGDATTVNHPVKENFAQIKEHMDVSNYADTLNSLENWSRDEFIKLESMLTQRKADGYIRECHGDMHLRNMLWMNDRPMAFDCIEFNPALRWIDVISEVAFLVMDLQDRQQQQLANRFLNSYLEDTGDYAGLAVLPYYLTYRALVRAKVSALRLEQKTLPAEEQTQALTEFESYLELASSYIQPSLPRLIIMRGLSASGKSTVSQQLLEATDSIRIRSDVERKRLFDVPTEPAVPAGSGDNKINAGIYSKQASVQTYNKLLELASLIVSAGYNVIVDAAFLKYEQRKPFQQLADTLSVPYVIIETVAEADILRDRIIKRKNDVSDADLEVLEHQLQNWQPLQENEIDTAISVDTGEPLDITTLVSRLNKY